MWTMLNSVVLCWIDVGRTAVAVNVAPAAVAVAVIVVEAAVVVAVAVAVAVVGHAAVALLIEKLAHMRHC